MFGVGFVVVIEVVVLVLLVVDDFSGASRLALDSSAQTWELF